MKRINNDKLPASSASTQQAHMVVSVLERCHTEIHRIIEELKRGSPIKAKQQISLIISWLANALSVL